MLIWGHRPIDRCEEHGEFVCPRCQLSGSYSLWRTYKYWHFYFVPILRQDLLAESVLCDRCLSAFPITVLAGKASKVMSPFEAGQRSDVSAKHAIGNIVTLSEGAAAEILKRQLTRRFGHDVAARISPGDSPSTYSVAFDIAVADGRDWIGESRGVIVVVDRRDAPLLLGKTIDFRNGTFCDGQSISSV